MPRIFDNLDQNLDEALCDALKVAYRADFSVDYFSLRGWRKLDRAMNEWPGGVKPPKAPAEPVGLPEPKRSRGQPRKQT